MKILFLANGMGTRLDHNKDNISFGINVKVHPYSRIIGPTYMGNDVIIGEKVIIKNSIIGDNVTVEAESRIAGRSKGRFS